MCAYHKNGLSAAPKLVTITLARRPVIMGCVKKAGQSLNRFIRRIEMRISQVNPCMETGKHDMKKGSVASRE